MFVGAMSVVRFAKPGSKSASAWLLQLLAQAAQGHCGRFGQQDGPDHLGHDGAR
jgi:hypothetical protein